MFKSFRQKSTETPKSNGSQTPKGAGTGLESPPRLRTALPVPPDDKSSGSGGSVGGSGEGGGSGGGGGGGGGGSGGTSSKTRAAVSKKETNFPAMSAAFLAEESEPALPPLSTLFSHSGQTGQYTHALPKALCKTRLSVFMNALGSALYEQCEADLLHFAMLSAYRDHLLDQAHLLAAGSIKQEAHLNTSEWRNTLTGYYAAYPTVTLDEEEDDEDAGTTLAITGNQFLNALTLLAALPHDHCNQKTVTAILRFAYRPLLPDALYQAHAPQLEPSVEAAGIEVQGSPQDIRNALLKELTDLGFTKNNEGNTFDSQQLILWQKETLFLIEIARHFIVEKLEADPGEFSESDFVRQLEALRAQLQNRRPRISSRPGRSLTRTSSSSEASRSLRTRTSSRHLEFEEEDMGALATDIQRIKAIIRNEPAPSSDPIVSEAVAIDITEERLPDEGLRTPLRPKSGTYAVASTASYGALLRDPTPRTVPLSLFSDYPPHILAMFYRKFIDERPGVTAQLEYIHAAINHGTVAILLESSTHPDIIKELLAALLDDLWKEVFQEGFEALPEKACFDLPLINLLGQLAFHPLFPDHPTKKAYLHQAVNKAKACLGNEAFCEELVLALAKVCDGLGTGHPRFSDLRRALFLGLLLNTAPTNPLQSQRWELLRSAAPTLIAAWSQQFLRRLEGTEDTSEALVSIAPAASEGWLPLIADFDEETHQFSLNHRGFDPSALLSEAIPPVHQDVYRVLSRFFLLNAHTGRVPTTVAAQRHLLQLLQTSATRFFPAKQGAEKPIQELLADALPSNSLNEPDRYRLAQALWIAHINYILRTPAAMNVLRSFAAAELRSVARQSGAAETKRAFIFEEHAQRELLEIHLTILKASIQRKRTIGLKLLSAALTLIPTILFGVSTYEFIRHNDPKFTVIPQTTEHAGNINLILASTCGSLFIAVARSLWHFTTPTPKRLLAELADFDASCWQKMARHWGFEAALFTAVHSVNLYMLYLDSQNKIYEEIKDNSFFEKLGYPGLIIFILNLLIHLTLAPWLMRMGERVYYEWAPQGKPTDVGDGIKEINEDVAVDGKETEEGFALHPLVRSSVPRVTRTKSIILDTPAHIIAQTEVAAYLPQESSVRSLTVSRSDSKDVPVFLDALTAHPLTEEAGADGGAAAPSKIGSWTDVRTLSTNVRTSQRGVALTRSPTGGRR